MKALARFNLVLTALLCLIAPLNTHAQFTQQGGKLVGTGAVGSARQGQSISISGDGNTALVGGYTDNDNAGAAWVWTRSGGVWTQQGNKLVGAGAVGSAQQGFSISLSADGNTALVGGYTDNGNAGAAWVWTRSGGVWTQQGNKLVGTGAISGGFGSYQGYSVCLSSDGNTAIVGGALDNGYVGAAWVWTRTGGVWTQQGNKLVGTGGVGSTAQGRSVSLSADGNTAIIGGIFDNGNAGAAWVWTRSSGVWTQQGSKLVGTDVVGSSQQGFSVSLTADGNTALIGGNADNSNAGAAWAWTRSGGVWTQQGGKLVGTGAVGNAYQGTSVALSSDGNSAIIGGNADNGNAGAAWSWTRSVGVWTQQGIKLVGTGAIGNAYQGTSVAFSSDGNTAILGGNADNGSAGATWVYARLPTTPTLNAPANNSVSIPVSGNLTWVPSSKASSYRVQLSTDSNFTTVLVNDSTGTDAFRSVGPLLNETIYYWRVNAKNSAGTSAYSSTWKFTTVVPPPAAPILIAPVQNANILSVAASLSWTASAGATSYRLQVSANSGFTTSLLNDSTLTVTNRAFTPLTDNTVYYWRVNAKNAGGTSAYSATWSFNTNEPLEILPKDFTPYRLNLENGKSLRFVLAQKERVLIQLINAKGQRVSQLLDETRDAGSYTVPLTKEAQGAYYLDFRAGDFRRTMKLER